MRRLLNPVVRDLMARSRSVADDWDAFWFRPADPTLLGLLRILTGLMLLYTHAVWGLVLAKFFGPASWLSPALVRAIQQDQYNFSFWWLVAGRLDVASLRVVHGRPSAVHAGPLHPRDLDPVAAGRDLVRPPRAASHIRPRPDQRHAHACIWPSVPAGRPCRSTASLAGGGGARPCRGRRQVPGRIWHCG